MSIDQSIDTCWVRAYTPGGFQTGIMVNLMPAADLDKLLTDYGYLCCEPGLEPGQEKETILRVVRRQKHNDDGTQTAIIDFYNDKFNFKFAHLYLNNEDDIRQFEMQSGLKLSNLKLYEGNTALDKEKSAQLFNQFSQQVARSFAMVRTPDGEWNAGMPKYKYSYFAEVALDTAPETETQQPAQQHTESPTPGQWATEDNLNVLVDMLQETLGREMFFLGEFAELAGIKKADDLGAWNAKFATGKEAYEAALRSHAKSKGKAASEQPVLMEETTNSPKLSKQAARFTSA